MIAGSDIRAEALRLQAGFINAGAVVLETSILQPADLLLDLYGEDIRARAYVTSDPLRGEQMLRPDFTVPVVQMHMAEGAEPARYTYAGEVFRRQQDDMARANEYFQVGYEIFDARTLPQLTPRYLCKFTMPCTGCLCVLPPVISVSLLPQWPDCRRPMPANMLYCAMSGGPTALKRCSSSSRAASRCRQAAGLCYRQKPVLRLNLR